MNNQIETISKWLGAGSINIFGLPYAGKDTQCHKLADLLGGVVLGGGDIMRSYADQAKVKQIMSEGKLIPSDLFLSIVLPFLSQPEFTDKPLILSSVGRMFGEETVIMEATERSGHPTRAVFLLKLSEDEVWRRFDEAKVLQDRGQRNDDDHEVLKTRLNEFKEETVPVLEFYRQKGLLIEIDGMLTREEVTEEIQTSLIKLAST